MTSAVTRFRVNLDIPGGPHRVGTLAWSIADRTSGFEFDASFLALGLALSPIQLLPSPTLLLAPRRPFDGLHGLFADSLPDGWGRLLVDRQMTASGRDPASLSPLDRLAIVGSHGMGALTYEPERPLGKPGLDRPVDLDLLGRQADALQQGKADVDIDAFVNANGGSAGARPKVLVLRDRVDGRLRLDAGTPARQNEDAWILKFKSRGDPGDSGRTEHAFALMAKAAGIDFPDTMLMTGASGSAYFAARRFDRSERGRIHVHTLAGMLHTDFRTPSLDYDELLRATRYVTKSIKEVEEAFRRAVFNVMAGNRDDHEKNHAFVMAPDGTWRLSPAYDVTPSEGPGGEHSLTVSGEGRNPTIRHLMQVADKASVRKDVAMTAIDQARSAISRWGEFAGQAEMRSDDARRARTRLEIGLAAVTGRKMRISDMDTSKGNERTTKGRTGR